MSLEKMSIKLGGLKILKVFLESATADPTGEFSVEEIA